jgi:hypothetical protein
MNVADLCSSVYYIIIGLGTKKYNKYTLFSCSDHKNDAANPHAIAPTDESARKIHFPYMGMNTHENNSCMTAVHMAATHEN